MLYISWLQSYNHIIEEKNIKDSRINDVYNMAVTY